MVPKTTTNPWDALFASITRPRPLPDVNAASSATLAGGYTILIQHSITSASQRLHALTATVSGADRSKPSINSLMASLSISKSSASTLGGERFGIAPFVLRNAFDELCVRCDGSVVFVSILGNGSVIDTHNDVLDTCDVNALRGSEEDGSVEHGEMQKRRKAVRLFRENGAMVDLASNPFGWADETSSQDESNEFVTKSTMNSLQSIADAIRSAVASVESRRNSYHATPLHNKSGQCQAIPIIFDSMTPLLSLHGVHNISLFLQSFNQVIPTSSTQSILSPIVATILYESISPADHRILEDMADAFISLHLKNTGNHETIGSGVLDLVRHGGGGRCLGGKLMRECVPVHIMRSVDRHPGDERDGCYWVLECQNKVKGGENTVQLKQQSNTQSSDDGEESKTAQSTNRPRIYLEDDDPEFDDFDEEDPDDDLDI